MPDEKKLTPKQAAFVREYLLSWNATEAAKKAGYSKKTAYSIGEENLKKPEIQQELQKHYKKVQEKFEITQESIIRELAMVGFGNLAQIVDEDGNIVDEERAAFLSSISRSSSSGAEGNSSSSSFGTHNKVKALELLGKHCGLWKVEKDANGAGDDTGNRKAILGRIQNFLRKPKQ